MGYLDVNVLKEAILEVEDALHGTSHDFDLNYRSLLISVAYERMIRGETPSVFLKLFSEQQKKSKL